MLIPLPGLDPAQELDIAGGRDSVNRKVLVAAPAAAAAALVLGSAVAFAYGPGGPGGRKRPFGFFPFGLLGGLAGLLFLAGAALLVIWVLRAAPRRAYSQVMATPVEAPLDILARRLASGEITADEYQKARDLLGGAPKA
jgi:uncharacterized membrane protein